MVRRSLLAGAAAAGALLLLFLFRPGGEPAPPTMAELAAGNYRVLTRQQSRGLVRYAEGVQRCLVANGVKVSPAVASSTRITMQAPGESAKTLSQRLLACDSTAGPPPAKASLQARQGVVLVYLPKQCLLDPAEVDS